LLTQKVYFCLINILIIFENNKLHMKNLVFLLSMVLLGFVACKQDGGTTTTEPAVPAATPTPTATTSDSPVKAAEPAVPTGPITTMEFTEDVYDFGEVMDGEKVKYDYKFKNTGSEPLIISNAKGSCGCTVPSWPREPIPPGGEAVIAVQFDSKNKGKVGGSPQSKRVTITANTDPVNTYLTIKGTVNKDEAAANPS